MVDSNYLRIQSGITQRQMEHWSHKGWLEADRPEWAHTGIPHNWPVRTVQKATVMSRLVRAGFRPERAHEIAEAYLKSSVAGRIIPIILGDGLILRVGLSAREHPSGLETPMICPNCKRAGELLQYPERVLSGEPGPKELHARCLGGTRCDCQHDTDPNMINLERVNRHDQSSTS